MKPAKMIVLVAIIAVLSIMSHSATVIAGGHEDYNGCRLTSDNPYLRQGSCSIKGSAWYQLGRLVSESKYMKWLRDPETSSGFQTGLSSTGPKNCIKIYTLKLT
jgi:hypothetical protein